MDLGATGAQNPPISLDETEMLIRSTSTLLSLVHPLAGESKRRGPEQDMAQFLDRFSIIFVSGRHHDDAVATVPIFYPDKKLQVVAMTQEPGEQKQERYSFHIVKTRIRHMNLPESHLGFTEPTPYTFCSPLGSNEHMTQLARELQEDEISFFIRRGHDPLTFDLHVRHLKWLLNRTYKRHAEPTTNDLGRLKKYVYLYCVPKIMQRFDMELSRGRGKFINFFLETNRTSYRVSYEIYEKLILVEPPDRFSDFKPKWSEETWLAHRAKQLGGELALDQADPSSIERTTKAGYRMYLLIATHFRILHRGLTGISPYINASPNLRTANATNHGEINNALTDIATALGFLHRALSYSRAFWRTIFTMGTHFQNQVLETTASSSVRLSTGGEQASSGESVFVSAPEASGVEPEVNEENSPMGNIDETSDAFNPADLDRPLIKKIRQWLILLTQWYHVLANLEKYLPSLCKDLTAPLEIQAHHADHATNPRQQAGLFETLAFIGPNTNLKTKVTAIKAAVSNETTTNSRALLVLRNLKDDKLEDPKEWAEAFAGNIHCEAQLYRGLKEIGMPYAVIGVSRRCCFCCNRLLEEAHLSPATHGRVYPWASPNGLDGQSKRTILDELKKHLQRFFMAATQTEGLSTSEHSSCSTHPDEDSFIQSIPW